MHNHADKDITTELLLEIQNLLYRLLRRGSALGPHLALCAVRSKDKENPMRADCPLDLVSNVDTFGDYFRFFKLDPETNKRVFKPANRGFYDPDLYSLLNHHSRAAIERPGRIPAPGAPLKDPRFTSCMCGRCGSKNHKKPFRSCRQLYFEERLLASGCCSNCQYNGNNSYCSMNSTFLIMCRQLYCRIH